MLDLPRCTLIETIVYDTANMVSLVEEGSALVQILEGGVAKVQPSTGAADEVFIGAAVGRPTTPSIVPYFETVKVPASAPYTVTLARPINGSEIGATQIESNGTRTPLTVGSATDGSQFSVAGNTLTFDDSAAGKTVQLRYRYNISYQEASFLYNFNGWANDTRTNIGVTGVCTTGIIYTDCFDLGSDWSAFNGNTPVKLGAGGRFTLSGSGKAIDATVHEVPFGSEDARPFLALGFGLKHS